MIHIEGDFTIAHLEQFVDLWIKVHDYVLHDDMDDSISWTLTDDGQYSAASAYKAQFFGATASNFRRSVWKIWAPPKVKFFAWLPFKIGFGRRIVCKREVGPTMPFVPFVRGVRNPSTTFLFIVDSPKDFGAFSKRGLGYIFLTSTHGMRCLFKIGGAS
jgi:hypothetical protein